MRCRWFSVHTYTYIHTRTRVSCTLYTHTHTPYITVIVLCNSYEMHNPVYIYIMQCSYVVKFARQERKREREGERERKYEREGEKERKCEREREREMCEKTGNLFGQKRAIFNLFPMCTYLRETTPYLYISKSLLVPARLINLCHSRMVFSLPPPCSPLKCIPFPHLNKIFF